MSDQWCTSYKRLFWVTFAAWSLITSRCSWVAASCGGILKSTWMCLLWNACETESPTVPILSQPVKSSPIFPTCSPHFILCDLSGLGSESYPTMQLTSTSGSRGNGERGHFKGLSGIQRIEKQLRSTVKVSPYPNRCDTTPLVPHARALVPLVYSSTPLHLQPHLPPIAPPYRKELLLPKSCCPQHSRGTSLSVSHTHTHACLLTALRTRTRARGGTFFSFPSWSSCASSLFPSHTHHLVNELIVFDSSVSMQSLCFS